MLSVAQHEVEGVPGDQPRGGRARDQVPSSELCGTPCSTNCSHRSSHGVSVIGDTLYMWGGEHEARTPVDTGMWALDLEEEEGAAMAWRRLDTRGDPPSPRSASRDTF